MSTITAVPLQPTKRSVLVYLWIGVALAVAAAFLLARQGASTMQVTPSGLMYKVVKKGQGGAHPTDADVALVNYEGKLLSGETFDKSQQPTPMPVKSVVPGFSEALKLLSKGDKYRFWIKPSLAYGDKANGPIPANSTLVFDVELLDFMPEAVLRQQMQMQQMMQQQQGGMPGGGGAAPGAGPPPAP